MAADHTVGGLILAECRGRVALLTLNRPERRNAWTPRLWRELLSALARAEADPGVRAIVITGAGSGFCAGADLELVASASKDVSAGGDASGEDTSVNPPVSWLMDVRKPLIAAINGSCAGIGLQIALACDVRFVAMEAKLSTAFVRRGLVAEHGMSWLLQRIVGRSRALDLLMSGRTFAGAEALRLGVADYAEPADRVLDAALAYATELADYSSPRAVAAIKGQVSLDATATLPDAMRRTEELIAASLAWEDVLEGVLSFSERRPPSFPPLGPPEGHSPEEEQ